MSAPESLAAAFGMGEDQDALRDAVRSVLARHAPLTVEARTTAGAADDDRLWQALTELGLPGMLVPEELGGAGLGLSDAAVALEEAGRVLLPAPLLSTTLAVAVLLACDDRAVAERVLPGIAAGRTIATVALAEEDGWSAPPATLALQDAGGWVVTGDKVLVLDGARADLLVVSACADGVPRLFLVESAAGGVTARERPAFDVTRRLADVHLEAAPAVLLPPAPVDVVDLAVVLLAAEQVGGAQQALDLTVEHATTRVQYGRAIGSFQAVKHRCADMLIQVEYGRSAASYASWAASSGLDELPVLAGVLKTVVADPFVAVCEQMIQLHGGMGFTWEHVAHLFYKRAVSDRLLFGPPEAFQDRSADLLGL